MYILIFLSDKKTYICKMIEDEIIEEHQDEICKHCESYIIDDIKGGNGWLCEGSYCGEAVESFFDLNVYKLRKYKLIKIRENLR